MIIEVTRKYISGSSKGKINKNIYNMDSWEEAIEWVEKISKDNDEYPFVVIEIKNDYGQHEEFNYEDENRTD